MYSGKMKWTNVSGEFTVELYKHDGKVFTTDTDKEIDFQFLRDIPMDDDHCYEIVIDFLSTGYYDPGCNWGPIENSYPPEGDDERELFRAYVLESGHEAREKIPLKVIDQQKLFAHYEEDIQNQEIETED